MKRLGIGPPRILFNVKPERRSCGIGAALPVLAEFIGQGGANAIAPRFGDRIGRKSQAFHAWLSNATAPPFRKTGR